MCTQPLKFYFQKHTYSYFFKLDPHSDQQSTRYIQTIATVELHRRQFRRQNLIMKIYTCGTRVNYGLGLDMLTGVADDFPLVVAPPKPLGSKLPNWKGNGFCEDCETGGGAATQKTQKKQT